MMTPGQKTTLLSVATLLLYGAFAFFRHRQFAQSGPAVHEKAGGNPSSFLLLAFLLCWALAGIAIVRHHRSMKWPAAAFCWTVCVLGGGIVGVFVAGLFSLVFR